MRRFLNSKLSIVALILAVVTLITGVAWAATSPIGNSSPDNQLTGAAAEIVPIPQQVEVNGVLQVAGSGLRPGGFALFEIVVGGATPNIVLGSGQANAAGAFLADTAKSFSTGRLPDILVPGVYTITATIGAGGPAATAPLIIVEAK